MESFDPSILKAAQDSKFKEFSFFDYIYSAGKGPEEAIIYYKLFWPDLIEVNSYVFLSENYDREYFDKTLNKYGAGKVEETINTTYLYYLVGGKSEYENDVWETLGNVLCVTWKHRAHSLFPKKKFVVEFAWYSESDDPGLTLFQSDRLVGDKSN